MIVSPIIQIVNSIFSVLVYLIIGRSLLSFFKHNPLHPMIRFVYDVTEPVMLPFRRMLPSAGGIDFSPVLAIMAIELVRIMTVKILMIFF